MCTWCACVCCCPSVGVAFWGGARLLGHVDVTDPIQVLQWAWHEVKGKAMAANEADYTSGIVLTVGQ